MAQRATWRTVDGDFDLTSSNRGIVRGKEAVAGCLVIAARTRQGDWFADLRAGVSDDLVTGRLAFLGQAETEYTRVCSEVAGVESASVRRVGVAGRTGSFKAEIYLDPDNGGDTIQLVV